MTELKNIFNFIQPQGLAFSHQKELAKEKGGIAFLSRGSKNNAVTSYVERIPNKEPITPNKITVALSGSVLECFYHNYEFYTPYHLLTLDSKEKMELREIFYYISFIKKYKNQYSFGRQANRTIQDILVPEKHEIPSWVYEIEIPDYSDVVEPKENKMVELPSSDKWKEFLFPEVFEMTRGRGGKATDANNNQGNNFYIGASAENNGITQYTSLETTEKGNAITVANNGSVGASFYQKNDFLASSDITVITLKNKELNPFIALFLTTLIKQIGESFDYGRKWGITRMKESKISLPVDSNGNPDWQLMEDYIKSLPYSKYL